MSFVINAAEINVVHNIEYSITFFTTETHFHKVDKMARKANVFKTSHYYLPVR